MLPASERLPEALKWMCPAVRTLLLGCLSLWRAP